MKKLLFLILLLPLVISAQPGVKFENGMTWKEIQVKAKAENKFIFMDVYTTWCGPCKYMSDRIFSLENVGNFMNTKFINVKVQLDVTSADSKEVRSWYADARYIKSEYKVDAFPFYLIFNPAGQIVHKFIGAMEASPFLLRVAHGLDSARQYFTLIDQYKNGRRDPLLLRNLALASIPAADNVAMRKIGNEFIASQQDMFTIDNINFLNAVTLMAKDTGFSIINSNQDKFDVHFGQGAARKKLVGLIQAEVRTNIYKRISPNWTAIRNSVEKKYPGYSSEVTSIGKINYYQLARNWKLFQESVSSHLEQFEATILPEQLNDWAWTVFIYCDNVTCLNEALKWSKKSLEVGENHMFMDTYANIQYKLGNVREALLWEHKALVVSKNEEVYQLTLEKMNKGQITWKD